MSVCAAERRLNDSFYVEEFQCKSQHRVYGANITDWCGIWNIRNSKEKKNILKCNRLEYTFELDTLRRLIAIALYGSGVRSVSHSYSTRMFPQELFLILILKMRIAFHLLDHHEHFNIGRSSNETRKKKPLAFPSIEKLLRYA